MHNIIKETILFWDLKLKKVREDIKIAGSPERCEFRIVIEDQGDRLFICEKISHAAYEHKMRIIQTLEFLVSQNLPYVQPYILNKNREYIARNNHGLWQLTRFVDGVGLKRPEYVFHRWRGNALSDFLIKLNKKSPGIDNVFPIQSFSIKNYIYELIDTIGIHESELRISINPMVGFLEKSFMGVHDKLPQGFCHGDYHPLNVIWSTNGINAVIDWEFCGYKPEIYDVANLIGCIGMEDPESLVGDLITELIQRLRQAKLFSDLSWQYLLEFIVALRFAWLSEWLRKSDKEMIELEQVYMRLLIENKEKLMRSWDLQ
ncbi:MAG: aminoglycoside phosphotransferase family protein [Deltaproteobacteria bacterium]|nr:aminoglycoside phosphotransferase family protein [Deltaproteobacteria bacterium]